jgi:hypothetical protein
VIRLWRRADLPQTSSCIIEAKPGAVKKMKMNRRAAHVKWAARCLLMESDRRSLDAAWQIQDKCRAASGRVAQRQLAAMQRGDFPRN